MVVVTARQTARLAEVGLQRWLNTEILVWEVTEQVSSFWAKLTIEVSSMKNER